MSCHAGPVDATRASGVASFGQFDREVSMRTRGFGVLFACLALLPTALRAQEYGYPHYCCTDVGRFGPFENGTVNAGDQCSATDTGGVRHVGTACHGPASPPLYGPMDTVGFASH